VSFDLWGERKRSAESIASLASTAAALRKFIKRARGAMKFFAELALDECEMWDEDWH
jgi:hypothetical protein